MPKCQTAGCGTNTSGEICHHCRKVICSSCKAFACPCNIPHCKPESCRDSQNKCRFSKPPTGQRRTATRTAITFSCQRCRKDLKKQPPSGLCKACREPAKASAPAAPAPAPITTGCASCATMASPFKDGFCLPCFARLSVAQSAARITAGAPQTASARITKLNCRNCEETTSLLKDNFCAKCFTYMKRNKDNSSIAAALIALKISLTAAVTDNQPQALQFDSLLKIPTLPQPETKEDDPCYFHLLLTLEIFLHAHPVAENFKEYAGYLTTVYERYQKHYARPGAVATNLRKLLLVQTTLLGELTPYRGLILTLPNKPHLSIAAAVRKFILISPPPSATLQDAQFRTNHYNLLACTLMLSLAAPEDLTERTKTLHEKLVAYCKSSYDANISRDSTELPLSRLLSTI